MKQEDKLRILINIMIERRRILISEVEFIDEQIKFIDKLREEE